MLNKVGKKLGYKEDGFTIIEVMIVLAVAGLIMAIVLIAIPQLQRNQRNTARRDVVNRLKTEIDAFSGNNNGRVPATTADLNSLYQRYLDCGTTATAAAPGTSCGVNINDPTTGSAITMSIPSPAPNAGVVARIGTYGQARYITARSCDGESLVVETGNNRVYAMWVDLEGGSSYCVDNK
jgi:prepilin-type N-terminal cleavage/methylation domain-containing protein